MADLESRIATYQHGDGKRFFVATVQPTADKTVMSQLRSQAAAVVIVVDTSASQVGDYRADELQALKGVLAGLRPTDEVHCWLPTSPPRRCPHVSRQRSRSDCGGGHQAASPFATGQYQPNRRDGSGASCTAVVAQQRDQKRRVSGRRCLAGSRGQPDKIAKLIDALRADRVSVHSVAIGPSKNIELLASLANQTGGDLLMVAESEKNSALELGKQVGQAATMSPVWLSSIALPEGMQTIQAKRLPPLRLDRDAILIGTVESEPASTSQLQVSGVSSAGPIAFATEVTLEPSHPDFSFFAGMVHSSSENQGLLLPTAGSGGCVKPRESLPNEPTAWSRPATCIATRQQAWRSCGRSIGTRS